METLFENHYAETEENVKEACKYMSFRNWSFYSFCTFSALLLIFVTMDFIFGAYYNYSVTTLLFYYAIVIFTFFLWFCRYKRSIKGSLERQRESSGGQLYEFHTDFFEDKFINTILATGSVHTVEYASIKKIIETKTHFILKTQARTNYFFRKDAFVKGSVDEFRVFLKDKGL